MTDRADGAADWIVTQFMDNLGQDLCMLKRMIAADLRYAYQQGREDSSTGATIISGDCGVYR